MADDTMTEPTSRNVRQFESDTDFCPNCGAILPLPGTLSVVTCMNKHCRFQIDVVEFDGIQTHSHLVFNKREAKTEGLSSTDFSGPEVEHKCLQCGNEKMTYSTRQTRSADEGQTVFYSCPKCGFQEQEFS